VRKGPLKTSEKIGVTKDEWSLDPGENFEALEQQVLDDGTVRLRGAVGWVSLGGGRMERLDAEVITPRKAAAKERRGSIAQDGVKDVTTDYAQAAGALGAVAEKTFDVEQVHIKDKKVKKRVQLKVGGQGIMLFDGPKFLGSNTYSRMAKSWNLNTNKHTITIHPDPDSVKAFGIMSFVLVCVNQDEREVSDTMMAHASKIR
jgi:hypothetical protein